jgi:hypothetical protein
MIKTELYPKISISSAPSSPNILFGKAKITDILKCNDKIFLRHTVNARTALADLLGALALNKTDEVLIRTTSGGSYVSKCVTDVIKMHCRYTVNLPESTTTKLILIINEFGFKASDIACKSEYGALTVEDCAYRMAGCIFQNSLRTDYQIFSRSKFLPELYGGIILSKENPLELETNSEYQNLYYSENQLRRWQQKNRVNYNFILNKLPQTTGYFNKYDFPEAAVLRVNKSDYWLNKLREKLVEKGVECTVFYGNGGGFVLPCHFGLTKGALHYIAENFIREFG